MIQLTFAVPVEDGSLPLAAGEWLRLSATEIVVVRNKWLDVRTKLQPHSAKEI